MKGVSTKGLMVVAIAAIIGWLGCNGNLFGPSGKLLNHTDCKNNQGQQSLNRMINAQASAGANQSCIEYEYDANSQTLTFSHINAGFNCCPGEIFGEISIDGDQILIRENEKEAGCLCLCLMDLDYRIQNLKAGIYQVKVIEPYVPDDQEPMEFAIDLSSTTQGEYCVNRNFYPWGND